ncbi:hypothetical protein DPMN_178775 [Dreissena polymorpha]|uniref:Uncharacterized protein n=1 Tax=Dreissena polymorpha TaxID=45954 RepID=A0A9D4IK72_DREPO|nr:hypothetical protein DPMN_178775 [Dreissena polymorpha]
MLTRFLFYNNTARTIRSKREADNYNGRGMVVLCACVNESLGLGGLCIDPLSGSILKMTLKTYYGVPFGLKVKKTYKVKREITGRSHIYHLLEKFKDLPSECDKNCATCVSRSRAVVTDITIKDHFFDHRKGSKKKGGTVDTDRNSLQKGALGVNAGFL